MRFHFMKYIEDVGHNMAEVRNASPALTTSAYLS